MPNSWGYYMQGSDQQIEMEELGLWLNTVIQCPVHYMAFGKPIYECKCGILFPLFGVRACYPKEGERLLHMHATGSIVEGDWADLNHARPSIVRYDEDSH